MSLSCFGFREEQSRVYRQETAAICNREQSCLHRRAVSIVRIYKLLKVFETQW